jgi:hypothetical protein
VWVPALLAETVRVVSADRVLEFGVPPNAVSAGDRANVILVLKVDGISAARVDALALSDVAVTVGERRFASEFHIAGAIDRGTGEVKSEPMFLFFVPKEETEFALSLPDTPPIPFSARDPIAKTWTPK